MFGSLFGASMNVGTPTGLWGMGSGAVGFRAAGLWGMCSRAVGYGRVQALKHQLQPPGQAPTVPKKILARFGMLRHASSCWSRVPSFSESGTGFKNQTKTQ